MTLAILYVEMVMDHVNLRSRSWKLLDNKEKILVVSSIHMSVARTAARTNCRIPNLIDVNLSSKIRDLNAKGIDGMCVLLSKIESKYVLTDVVSK